MRKPRHFATRATGLLGCDLPIVLAGMGGVARSELVAAVTAAGGFGFLGMVRESPALIRHEAEMLRDLGHANFGVNIIPAATERSLLEAQIEAIIDLHIPAVALFWDIDADVVARFRDAGIVVAYQVGSAGEAIAAESAGAHLIIAQGIEAGGHVRATQPLSRVLPEVVRAVSVPVLAAGGLATGGDLVTSLALGADGIVLGTALMATQESFAHDEHKQRLLASGARDTVLTEIFHINWPPGAPVRVIASDVTAGRRGPSDPSDPPAIGDEAGRPIFLFSTDSPLRSMTGDFGAMALYAGTGVDSIEEIVPVRTRLDAIMAEAHKLLAATEVAELPESASAVCYAGEMGGAYMGTLEPAEIGNAQRAIAGDLQGLLEATLSGAGHGDAPPYVRDAYPLAAWALALRETTRPATPADAPDLRGLVRRMGELLPRLPEGQTRDRLSALRQMLDQRATAQTMKALQLSLTN